MYRVYLRSHAPGSEGRVDTASRTVTDDAGAAERAYRALLGRTDLIGTPTAAVLSSTSGRRGAGKAIYFSRFDRDLGDGRIHPDAPLDLDAVDDHTAKATRWKPPTAISTAMPDTGDFAADVRTWLAQRGWSQPQGAAAIDVPLRTFQEWCQGRQRPSVESAIRKLCGLV